jgi:ankyrin repeat protein
MAKNDLRSLRDALYSLPEGLDSAYDGAMERIKAQSSDDLELATKVLYWINCAMRPLTLKEVQIALAVRPGDTYLHEDGFVDEERLLSVCAGIVAIQNESNTIILVHYTAQEYFKEQGDKYFPQAQANITGICLTYLSFDTFGRGPCTSDGELHEKLKEHQFLEYAASYWGDHFSQDHEQTAKHLVIRFLHEGSRVSCCLQIIHKSSIAQPPGEQQLRHQRFKDSQHELLDVHSLWLAAYFNLTDIIELVLKNGTDVSKKTGYGETALHAAACRGNCDAVRLLLMAKADINAVNESRDSPLLIAASNMAVGPVARSGHESVIQLLIEEGADVTAKADDGWTALHLAAQNGHDAAIELLLERGADVAAKDNDGWTALHLAAQNGHETVVQLLLEKETDVTVKDNSGETALHLAALNGNEAMIKLLLETGADVAAKDNDGWTALHYAAQNGHKAVIILLLENGADTAAKDDHRWTALHLAAQNGHEAVVERLIENGVDIDANSGNIQTALHFAARKGHKAVVTLLLEAGADVAVKDNDGWTALHFAAKRGPSVNHMIHHDWSVTSADAVIGVGRRCCAAFLEIPSTDIT